MQSVSSRIWTRTAVSISCDDNHYTTCTPMDPHIWTNKSRMTSSYVRIRGVALKICRRRWTIGKCGERGSGISVLAAWHDNHYYYYYYYYSRVFANGPGDRGSIPGRIIRKTLNMVLDLASLNTQNYKVSIKGKVELSTERNSALPYFYE